MKVRGAGNADRGFTYLGLIFLVAMMGLAAAAAGAVWSVVAQRERETELLFVGQQYLMAIEQYESRSPPGAPRYPLRLEDLLRDARTLLPMRHLRRAYPDPFDFNPRTGAPVWGLVRSREGGIVGVHSLSSGVPMKRSGFPPGLAFETARSHRDWRFIAPSAVALAMEVAADTPAPNGVAPNPEPDTPAADEPAAPVPVRAPRQADYRNRTPDACQRIAAYDLTVCAEQALRFGAAAERDCLDSAVRRAAVCPFAAEPLPRLFLRNQ